MSTILDRLSHIYPEAVAWRRKLHQNAQPAWLELFATAFAAEKLTGWGYKVLQGKDVLDGSKRSILPTPEQLKAAYEQALAAGAKKEFLDPAQEGLTGVVAVLKGGKPGPTVGFRFDIDCNEVCENSSSDHRPAREGFASKTAGYGHLCGHDSHTAMGLLLARYFSEQQAELCGTVKFIFQPNEENMGGAVAMVDCGVVDDVDYLLGGHVGLNLTKLGQIALNVHSFLAMSRYLVTYEGRSSHAAVRPDQGKNALAGACTAVNQLLAIPRHGLGETRINVGMIRSGKDWTWNVVPDKAVFGVETRGTTNEVNEYMVEQMNRIIEGAAQMYDLKAQVDYIASGLGGANSPELVALTQSVAQELNSVTEIVPELPFNASEDVTVFMDRVQKRGGQALFAVFGTPTAGGHHNPSFDINEQVMLNGAEFLATTHQRITESGR